MNWDPVDETVLANEQVQRVQYTVSADNHVILYMRCTSIQYVHRLMQKVGRGDREPSWRRSTWSSGFSRLLIMPRYICTRDPLYHQKRLGIWGVVKTVEVVAQLAGVVVKR